MEDSLRNAVDGVLFRSPLQAVFRWRASRKVSVLAYHRIEHPEGFALQMDYVRREMYPVSLEEFVPAITGRAGFPRRAVLVTFDDGDPSVFDLARPILTDRGMPGVAFVVAGLIDTDTPPWWDEVELLAKSPGASAVVGNFKQGEIARNLKLVPDSERIEFLSRMRDAHAGTRPFAPQLRRHQLRTLESVGIAIGNHTLTHPYLSRCSDNQVEREITEAHKILMEATGRAPVAFAYPDRDTDIRAVPALRALGYKAGFLFDHRPNRTPLEPFRISRLRVGSEISMERFRTIISGLHPTIHRLRGLP
jgi:peptidoglycan/xylan/chitin deacetylase (PgdA/CDA1 family)